MYGFAWTPSRFPFPYFDRCATKPRTVGCSEYVTISIVRKGYVPNNRGSRSSRVSCVMTSWSPSPILVDLGVMLQHPPSTLYLSQSTQNYFSPEYNLVCRLQVCWFLWDLFLWDVSRFSFFFLSFLVRVPFMRFLVRTWSLRPLCNMSIPPQEVCYHVATHVFEFFFLFYF